MPTPSSSSPPSCLEEKPALPLRSTREAELAYAIRHHRRALKALASSSTTLPSETRRTLRRTLRRKLQSGLRALAETLRRAQCPPDERGRQTIQAPRLSRTAR